MYAPTPVSIPVANLKKFCNPFGNNPWGGPKMNRAAIRKALTENRLVDVPGTDDHAGRIAFLVKNEAQDPIEIDVGAPVLSFHPDWFIEDGNHRLAAAIFAGRTHILANVSGQVSYANYLFGVDCTQDYDNSQEATK